MKSHYQGSDLRQSRIEQNKSAMYFYRFWVSGSSLSMYFYRFWVSGSSLSRYFSMNGAVERGAEFSVRLCSQIYGCPESSVGSEDFDEQFVYSGSGNLMMHREQIWLEH